MDHFVNHFIHRVYNIDITSCQKKKLNKISKAKKSWKFTGVEKSGLDSQILK